MKKFYEVPLFEAVELVAPNVMQHLSTSDEPSGGGWDGDAPARHGIGGFALKQL